MSSSPATTVTWLMLFCDFLPTVARRWMTMTCACTYMYMHNIIIQPALYLCMELLLNIKYTSFTIFLKCLHCDVHTKSTRNKLLVHHHLALPLSQKEEGFITYTVYYNNIVMQKVDNLLSLDSRMDNLPVVILENKFTRKQEIL